MRMRARHCHWNLSALCPVVYAENSNKCWACVDSLPPAEAISRTLMIYERTIPNAYIYSFTHGDSLILFLSPFNAQYVERFFSRQILLCAVLSPTNNSTCCGSMIWPAFQVPSIVNSIIVCISLYGTINLTDYTYQFSKNKLYHVELFINTYSKCDHQLSAQPITLLGIWEKFLAIVNKS